LSSVVPQSLANHFGTLNAVVPPFLNMVDFAHRLLGPSPLQYISSRLNKASNHYIPEWNPYMPQVRPACWQLLTLFHLLYLSAYLQHAVTTPCPSVVNPVVRNSIQARLADRWLDNDETEL
jgi:hypothetical protein